jgi:hypothetical protein
VPTRDQWLTQGFVLCDHPFEPVRDPVNGLDLKAKKISLLRPLDIFALKELTPYFASIGSFQRAVSAVSDFLDDQGYAMDSATPPVLLIQGPRGAGRKTMGNFIASLMKGHCAVEPGFHQIPVRTAHFGRLLLEIKLALERHFTQSHVDTAVLRSRDLLVKAEDPDESLLAGLFDTVAQQNLVLPMLILQIDSVDYQSFDWIARLHGMCSALNIAFIFLTEDDLVAKLFRGALSQDQYIGTSVRLEPLTIADGKAFLQHRLNIFRTQPPPAGIHALTPFELQAIDWIFTKGKDTRTIKMLLNLYRTAMNRKLAFLTKSSLKFPPDAGSTAASIGESDVRDAYHSSVQKAGWGAE